MYVASSEIMLGECNYSHLLKDELLEIKHTHYLISARLCLLLLIHTRQVYYLKDKHLMSINV